MPAARTRPFAFDNSYARDLQGFYLPVQAALAPQPQMIKFNHRLALDLGLDASALDSPEGAAIFSGQTVPEGAQPIALAYAGHQFGGFSPQLGDGRALLLGEIIDIHGQRRDIALKGSGPTPFSRNGDGKAALGPVLREYLVGEAMHALGIATTRALAAVTTGEWVYRDTAQPGAILTRVAASHIRIGTFQYFAARGETGKLRQLADYAIARHYPELRGAENPCLAFLEAVCARQTALVAQWMLAGFIHGVMNTDNTSISGETIDYGPCAFLEHFEPGQVFSSIDRNGRYAYANQPLVLRWNLVRLAEALMPLLHAEPDQAAELANAVLATLDERHATAWLAGMRRKLGLTNERPGDAELARAFLAVLEAGRADYTLAFRHLGAAGQGNEAFLRAQFAGCSMLDPWLARWRARLAQDPCLAADRAKTMARANPAFIARNHRVEAAIQAALENQDFAPFETLLQVLARPFDDQPEHAELAEPASAAQTAAYKTFCGT